MAKDGDEKPAEGEEKKGKGKLIIMLLPTILLLAGGGWYFFLRSDGPAGPVVLPAPTPGAVVALDPMTINLAGGHFLKLGMTLQPTADAVEVSGAKALDLAINEYSGKTVDELTTEEGRTAAKETLIARVKLAYLPEGNDAALTAAITAAKAAVPDAAGTAAAATGEAGAAKTATATATPSPEVELAALSDKQAVAAAAALTVQTSVYNIYLTTFVMQ